jgi:hypothetical protein
MTALGFSGRYYNPVAQYQPKFPRSDPNVAIRAEFQKLMETTSLERAES